MNYQINFIPEALTDMKKLDHSVRPQVMKGIESVDCLERYIKQN